MQPIDNTLLAILRCPLSHATLVVAGSYLVSTDAATRRRYPIRDGFPVMLIDESETMTVEEWEKVMVRTNTGE